MRANSRFQPSIHFQIWFKIHNMAGDRSWPLSDSSALYQDAGDVNARLVSCPRWCHVSRVSVTPIVRDIYFSPELADHREIKQPIPRAKYGSRQAKVEAQNVYSLFSCLIIRFFVVIVIFGINDHCLGKMLTVWGGDRSLNRRAAAFMRRCCESVKIVVMLKVKSLGNLLIVSSTFTNQKPPWLYLSVNYLWGPILCNLGRTQFYLTLESFISREKNNAIRFWLCNLHNWNNNTKLNILQLDFEFAKHDAWKMK